MKTRPSKAKLTKNPLGNDSTVPSLPREPSDTELLDWLQKNKFILCPTGSNDGSWECGTSENFQPGFKGATARAAIRAAMNGTTP